jgi:hypothetical protein
MKILKLTGIILATVLCSVRAMAQQAEELVVPLSDPGKPYKLEVGLIFGSIKVTGYDGKDVVIETQTDQRRKRDNDDEDRGSGRTGMKRIATNAGLDITAKEHNNQVTISSNMPMRGLNLSIKVPQGASSIKVSTINGGAINISNVSGDLEVTNVNGAIYLSDISGSVVANTVNGNVKVNFKSIDTKAAMAFSTLNGNVDVTFPANLKASVKLKSDHGNIYTDFDIVTDKQATPATKTVKDGMYRLTVDETVYGKINGGGPEFLMKNMNGNIYLHKAK